MIAWLSRLFSRRQSDAVFRERINRIVAEPVATPVDLEIEYTRALEAMKREIEKTDEPKRRGGRPRTHRVYDLSVGESYRTPLSDRNRVSTAIDRCSRIHGKKFTTRAKANGLWIKRVA